MGGGKTSLQSGGCRASHEPNSASVSLLLIRLDYNLANQVVVSTVTLYGIEYEDRRRYICIPICNNYMSERGPFLFTVIQAAYIVSSGV